MTDMDKMMIEKVARALHDAEPPTYSDSFPPLAIPFDDLSPMRRARIDALAEAAVSAYNPDDRLSRGGTLFAAIEHGDEEHRAWLKEAIDKHFAGEAVPAPRGNGNSDRLREALFDNGNWQIRCRHLLSCIDAPVLAREDVILIEEIRSALSPLPQGDG